MKLFLFEFATCGERVADSIAVEGLAMFKTLYHGFKKHCEVLAFVREEFNFLGLPFGKLEEIENWLEKCDSFLIVAPEDEFILLNLTKKAEKYCENLGSSSRAIAITSDKWKLYKKLKGKVLMPKTSKKELKEKFLVKPRVSCGGEGIGFTEDVKNGFIAQEFISGKPLSVSLIVRDEIEVVSVNEQILENFRYKGAVVPARIDQRTAMEVCEEAIKAVESVPGLKGYVGVDLVYSDQPYVIEINARITTPIIAFDRAYGANVADMILGDFEYSWLRRQKIEKGNFEDYFAKVGSTAIRICDL
ncbi:MAG: ATP-grasp domain-containing protein [Archaeoglobaceae archaeon]|nr:ATP-grasp domain-containing protein [Archaeoglobaceae archaeon]MDW8128357.1 ATP-grasp domain-containing protein [Archaeoglobaceae archaeon]